MNTRTAKHVGISGLYKEQIEALCRAFPGVAWNIKGGFINCWTFERAFKVRQAKNAIVRKNVAEARAQAIREEIESA